MQHALDQVLESAYATAERAAESAGIAAARRSRVNDALERATHVPDTKSLRLSLQAALATRYIAQCRATLADAEASDTLQAGHIMNLAVKQLSACVVVDGEDAVSLAAALKHIEVR